MHWFPLAKVPFLELLLSYPSINMSRELGNTHAPSTCPQRPHREDGRGLQAGYDVEQESRCVRVQLRGVSGREAGRARPEVLPHVVQHQLTVEGKCEISEQWSLAAVSNYAACTQRDTAEYRVTSQSIQDNARYW